MGRLLLIVLTVGLLLATGVAGAAPTNQLRLPVTTHADDGHDTVTVEKGDNLWKISAHHLGTAAPSESIAPYWLRVIDENVATLRSGDPDLIYPGETIAMPDVSEWP